MTRERLEALPYLIQKIEDYNDRIARAEARAKSTVGTISAAPGGSSGKSDKIGNYTVLINSLKSRRDAVCRELNAVVAWVSRLPSDGYIRVIFVKHFFAGESFRRISNETGIDRRTVSKIIRSHILIA